MYNILNIFNRKLSKYEIAKMLNTNPKALEQFEKAYQEQCLDIIPNTGNLFDINSRIMAEEKRGVISDNIENLDDIIARITDELLSLTSVYHIKGKKYEIKSVVKPFNKESVSREEIEALPEEYRPQLTGKLMKRDLGGKPSYAELLFIYRDMQKEKEPDKKKRLYNHFRQGMDILDLDHILYQMIGLNPNSMGNWLPSISEAVTMQGFFKIPETTIIKVPLSLLQLTRLDYLGLTRTTLDIVDKFCYEAFNLDENKEYFIKTGTYSSKFDFRNAYVRTPKEVRELGEYLLFIHWQANQMASPFSTPSIYGVSTTNEWVVREFIPDTECNPRIYKGLPLRTEYRVFVDFDTNKVIGINPYWDPNVMKQRFGNEEDADSPHQRHDYIIYTAHEERLMKRYEENKDMIMKKVEDFLPNVSSLSGQWSIDIMQNGDDFWLIDMALAQNSALIECVPKALRKEVEENWLPQL